MSQTTGSPTTGIRTWRRTGASAALPLDARVEETTDPADVERALREADFVTVPREGVAPTDEVLHAGYDDGYALALAAVLQARYGYSGLVRTSTSGRSHVFERVALSQGAAFDFGLSSDASPPVGSPPSGPVPAMHGMNGTGRRPTQAA